MLARLGWVLYLASFVIAGLWLVGCSVAMWGHFDWGAAIIVGVIAFIIVGVGRAALFVLAAR